MFTLKDRPLNTAINVSCGIELLNKALIKQGLQPVEEYHNFIEQNIREEILEGGEDTKSVIERMIVLYNELLQDNNYWIAKNAIKTEKGRVYIRTQILVDTLFKYQRDYQSVDIALVKLKDFKTQAKKEVLFSSTSNQIRAIPLKLTGKIVFDDVWFSYVPGEWVLKGVSFSVEPESTLAVVGETGSGKSTIISLLSRFYTVQKGRITIDGIDINEIPYQVLRKNISTVMQDVFLFSRTIKNNIVLNEIFEKERFQKIVQYTNANFFLEKLPQKENEMVMERGVTLSAGERQLLAFARSLYAQPTILVLDEATSNIDTHTEQLIQAAITELTKNRTTIAIAHRLSTVRNADQIIVIDKGTIVESGTHDSLIANNGLYYDLYRLQFENT
jgi:ABC-type multidrug transport system fused ATPase/permease subunit